MKVLLYGRYGEYVKDLEPLVTPLGFEIVSNPSNSPDVVITFGGDGTLLGSERDYPGIPKLPLRNSEVCVKCSTLPNEEILALLSKNKLQIQDYTKLQVNLENQEFTAVNDVVIRNAVANIALRFQLMVNGESISPNSQLIGDGVIIATPFGSSGYYYSIARNTFDSGIGVAFNNIHNSSPRPLILDNNAQLEIIVMRGPADLAIDNDPKIVKLSDGAKISVKLSSKVTKILTPV